jgi:hypothetical protein
MANVFATASGLWSTGSTWNTGTVPTSSDAVFANGFTVTINQNVDVVSLSIRPTGSILTGGVFNLSASVPVYNVKADLYSIATKSTREPVINQNRPCILNVTGSIYPSSGLWSYGIYCTVDGTTLNVSGSVFCGNGQQAAGIVALLSSQTVNITGDCYGYQEGSAGIQEGAIKFSSNTSTNNYLKIVGNVYGKGGSSGGNPGYGVSVTLYTNSTFIFSGSAFGGDLSTVPGIALTMYNNGNTFLMSGSAIGGTLGPGITISGVAGSPGASIIISEAKTISGSQGASVSIANSFANVVINKIVNTSTGYFNIAGPFKVNPAVFSITLLDTGSQAVTYTNNTQTLVPSQTDVRSGVSYYDGARTGTLVVPSPSNVRKSIQTDNTTGSVDLTAADFWNYMTSNLTVSESIGERLKNSSTVSTTGAQIAAFNI